jgi:hypothetical protein
MRFLIRLTGGKHPRRHTRPRSLPKQAGALDTNRRKTMVSPIIRAAAFAALTSAIGYAVMAYRTRKQQEKYDKLAAQEWETDGGSNMKLPQDSATNPGGAQARVV